MNINWKRLREPFPPQDIEWKPGAKTRDGSKGLAMAYITARAVQTRLDEVFGPDNWKNEYRPGPDGGVMCRIYFRNSPDDDWVWREDGAENTEFESVKGGLSNALKRAGSALGIGRYLYEMPSQWVALNDKGRFAEVPTIPDAFLPAMVSSTKLEEMWKESNLDKPHFFQILREVAGGTQLPVSMKDEFVGALMEQE